MKKPIIACMYDFDKTLCPKDMQEYSFIPKLNMEPRDFWQEVEQLATEEKMDRILAYMYLMIRKSKNARISIKKSDFQEAGTSVTLFDGVSEWFTRMEEYGDSLGVCVEHYIISSGLKEIIEGTSIKKHFKEIYACTFHYDENGVADWPALTVNYTNKTQYLFRINKGILNIHEDEKLNEYIEDNSRRVPFRNMLYFGDGFTDIPSMKLVKMNGGQSIAVYTDKSKVEPLLRDGRVDFILPADYQEGSQLDCVVKKIIHKMAIVNELVDENHQQISKMKEHVNEV